MNYLNNHKIRGIRNNNPGNLIFTSSPWLGKIPKNKSKDFRFEQFETMEYGVRAMIKNILVQINKGHNTIEKLIHVYAPPFENDTKMYINSVAKTVGVAPNVVLKSVDNVFLLNIARAILKVENGASHTLVTDEVIKRAITMLGTFKMTNLSVKTTLSYPPIATIFVLSLFSILLLSIFK